MSGSGFIVEFAIAPGGYRRHDLVVVGTVDDVIRVLEIEFGNDDSERSELSVELALVGMTVRCFVIDDGELRNVFDLRPFLNATFADGRAIALGNDEIAGDVATTNIHVDEAAARAALPRLAGEPVSVTGRLRFQIDGVQAKAHGAEALYFLAPSLSWGYRDLEGAATPHLRAAFRRTPKGPASKKKKMRRAKK